MTTARDVVAYIESRLPQATEMQLCKLAYYAQAWNIVWEGRPLFPDRIEAWKYGPVPVACWSERKYGTPQIPEPLDGEAKQVVSAIIDFYGRMSASELSRLSHQESPWKDARDGLPDDANCSNEITVASMRRYYTRQALTRGRLPQRVTQHRPFPVEEALALADQQADRWQGTLARLADR